MCIGTPGLWQCTQSLNIFKPGTVAAPKERSEHRVPPLNKNFSAIDILKRKNQLQPMESHGYIIYTAGHVPCTGVFD